MRLPQTAPPLTSLMQDLAALDPAARLALFADPSPLDDAGRYLPWDEVRHRRSPDDLTHRAWWLRLSTARRSAAVQLPLLGKAGLPFWFSNAPPLLIALNRLDRELDDHPLSEDGVLSRDDRQRHLVHLIIDESIRSSQLEGASTSRIIAREMLRDGRPSRDHSERMIANNFAAMQLVEQWANERRTVDLDAILALHRTVTDGTLPERDVGRLQTPDDARVYVVSSGGGVVHQPPPAAELPERIERLCAFAGAEPADPLVHPVVRAVLLHFMIGYDHPFADGNGRTARCLFYWSLLRSGFWLAPYLPISQFLLEAPAQYSRAYQYVTADGNDATHFLLHQLNILLRAADQLHDYLRLEQTRSLAFDHDAPAVHDLNDRQAAVIREALADPGQRFTIARQRREHRISYATARDDLLDLEARALLTKARTGKKFVFRPAPDLPDRLGGAAR